MRSTQLIATGVLLTIQGLVTAEILGWRGQANTVGRGDPAVEPPSRAYQEIDEVLMAELGTRSSPPDQCSAELISNVTTVGRGIVRRHGKSLYKYAGRWNCSHRNRRDRHDQTDRGRRPSGLPRADPPTDPSDMFTPSRRAQRSELG